MPSPIETRHLTIRRRQRYAVRGERERPRRLWFVLHGWGQTAPRFLRYFEALDDGSRLLVAPEGLHRHYLDHENRKVGASWMTSEDRLTDVDDYVAYLDRLQEHVLAELSRAPEAVVALGFSQGVHTLARWISFGRARIGAAVLWGSHLPPDLDLAEHAGRWRACRTAVVGGDDDPHFGEAKAAEALERLESAGIPAVSLRFEGGHRVDREALLRVVRELEEGQGDAP